MHVEIVCVTVVVGVFILTFKLIRDSKVMGVTDDVHTISCAAVGVKIKIDNFDLI